MQANVSLLGASACGAGGQTALAGRYPLSEALTRVLAGAPCTFHIVDARTVRISALTAAPAPVAAPGAPAQPVVDELLVTARKRPEREDSLPAGVSVISADQLFATNAYDVRDTAGQLVGVLTTNLGPGRDKLLMRGLSDGAFTGRARSTVSTYLDDAPINYNAPDPDLRLTDVAQIETVRGPQGALYGNGALAGVYRIVTNKPDPDHYAAGAQASYATTQGGSPSYSGEGYANMPLADGRAALRLVAYYDDEGGYLDDVSLRLSNVDSTVRTGGRAALRLELNSDWTLDMAVVGQRLSSRDSQYTTLSALNERANQVREASNNDFAQGQVTLRGELGWADLSSSTSYVQHAYANLYDATAVASVFAADSAFSDNGVSVGVYSEGARIHRLVQDVVLTSTGAGALSWLVGAYGSLSVERTPSSLDILPKPGQPIVATTSLQGSGGELIAPALSSLDMSQSALVQVYNENRRDNVSEAALYGETTWRFAPGWSASAGTRVSETNLDVKAAIVGAPPAQSRDVDESRSFSGVTSKLSVQYQFDDEGPLLYALYSEGFRPGGVNSTGFLPIRPSRINFDPDRLMNFELGAKGQFLDKHLILRAATFFDIWTNIQSDQYRPSGLAYTANVGDAHIQGMEAEAAYDWDFGLSLQGNALYSAPKFTRTNPDFAGELGSGLPGAPRWSGGLVANYVRPLPYRDLKFRLVGQANYTGPARLTFDQTLSARTDPLVDAEILAELDSSHWRAGLFITNPADTAGNTFAYGNPFTFGQVRQVTPQRPRTVGVRLATAF